MKSKRYKNILDSKNLTLKPFLGFKVSDIWDLEILDTSLYSDMSLGAWKYFTMDHCDYISVLFDDKI